MLASWSTLGSGWVVCTSQHLHKWRGSARTCRVPVIAEFTLEECSGDARLSYSSVACEFVVEWIDISLAQSLPTSELDLSHDHLPPFLIHLLIIQNKTPRQFHLSCALACTHPTPLVR